MVSDNVLREWLNGVSTLAVREFAGGNSTDGLRKIKKPEVIEMILVNPDFRWMAEESRRIELESRARVAASGVDPEKAWAERFALPW